MPAVDKPLASLKETFDTRMASMPPVPPPLPSVRRQSSTRMRSVRTWTVQPEKLPVAKSNNVAVADACIGLTAAFVALEKLELLLSISKSKVVVRSFEKLITNVEVPNVTFSAPVAGKT